MAIATYLNNLDSPAGYNSGTGFARSIATDDQFVVVGEINGPDGNGNGKVYVYTSNGTYLHELVPTEALELNADYGHTVALWEGVAFASTPYAAATNGNGDGQVWAFDPATGNQLGLMEPPAAYPGDSRFGSYSIYKSGNRIYISSPDSGPSNGYVHVYNATTYAYEQTLVSPVVVGGLPSKFGLCVRATPKYVLISAPDELYDVDVYDRYYQMSGRVYVYHQSDLSYSHAIDCPVALEYAYNFGWAMEVFGSYVYILAGYGGYFTIVPQFVKIDIASGTVLFTTGHPDLDGNRSSADEFYYCFALTNNYSFIQTYHSEHPDAVLEQGTVHVVDNISGAVVESFENYGFPMGGWTTTRPIALYEHANTLKVSGNYLYWGAKYERIMVYDISGTPDTKLATGNFSYRFSIHPPVEDSWMNFQVFGDCMACNQDYIVAGDWRLDSGSGANHGAAYVFNASDASLRYRIIEPDTSAGDYFAYMHLLYGNTLLITSNFSNFGYGGGSVWVYDARTGEKKGRIDEPDGYPAGNSFGWPSLISNSLILLSSTWGNTLDYISLYSLSDLSHVGVIPDPAGSTLNEFGYGSAATDSHICATSRSISTVYIFNRSNLALRHTITRPYPGMSFFGTSVTSHKNLFIVSSASVGAGEPCLVAYDGTTGSVVWEAYMPPAPANQPTNANEIYLFGDSVYVADGYVYLSSPTWNYYTDNSVFLDVGVIQVFNADSGAYVTTLEVPQPQFSENMEIGGGYYNTFFANDGFVLGGSAGNSQQVHVWNAPGGLSTFWNRTRAVTYS